MKIVGVLLSLFLWQVFVPEPPEVPSATPNPEFPLRVHLFGVHWNYNRYGYQGYGRADLLGNQPQGMDYTFRCGHPFLHNAQRAEFYQARWKKQNQSMELLMQRVGSEKTDKCEIKVAMKPMPYGKYGSPTPSISPR